MTNGKSAGGMDSVAQHLLAALQKPSRVLVIWFALNPAVSLFIRTFLDAWMVQPLPFSATTASIIVTFVVTVPILSYYPKVTFGRMLLFSIATVAFFLVLNAVAGGNYTGGAGLHGSLYIATDVVLLWTAAVLFAYVLVVRTDW